MLDWVRFRHVANATKYDFDLFTIGGGSGGVRGSRWAAMQYGAKVAVAELPFAIVSSKLTAGGLGGEPSENGLRG
eukprot:g24483.t1